VGFFCPDDDRSTDVTRTDPLAAISTRATPQTEQARPDQVRNSAGGYVFATGDDVRVQRFLVLGTTGGTYYASERELTADNAALILETARTRGTWLADQVRAVSVAGRAPRQQPGLFALAAVIAHGDDAARQHALAMLPEIARTGSTLFQLVTYVGQFRGWGRGLRRAVASWYLDKDADQLAYQLVKYRSRNGWSHRDLLRLTHPKLGPNRPGHAALFAWLAGSPSTDLAVPELVEAFATAQRSALSEQWRHLAERSSLPWEAYPDAALTEPDVWRALLEYDRVPLGALIRQLPRLTRLGVLDDGAAWTRVASRLIDSEALKRARIHPINVLVAQRTYASGSGKGSTWTPNRHIVDALDQAFYAAFGAVTPSGGRTLLALDVSGSMSAPIAGMPISAREGAAAMALVTLATEKDADVVGFTSGRRSDTGWGRMTSTNPISRLDITPRRRLDDVVSYVGNLDFGATDCALPILWARQRREAYDSIVIYTDNETWSGDVHPHQALKSYRGQVSPNARLAVVGMTSTGFSIADPLDPGQLDVVGFDSATPQLIADFAGGRA
jgi:60 kDa SS-A/Ro ribonucleoprotein